MSDIQYQGSVVNSTITEINNISNKIPSLSASIKSATNTIVSARGFNQYVGGLSSNSFSSAVDGCQGYVSDFVKGIRDIQIKVLAYSQDMDEINAFLDTLNRSDYDSLNLTELNSYIGLDRQAGNIFKGIIGTVDAAALGLAEGLGELVETGADLFTLAGTGVASIFTGLYDLFTGSKVTENMWKETKAWVSDKKVENIFNSLYNDTEFGQMVKNNAYGFDTVRGITKGLGYTAGMIGLTAVTGGLASGLGIGASGSISAGQLALTAGTFGIAGNTEEAWADGADITQGLTYGAVTGAWEGLQWFLGAKINQYGGLGDKIAQGIFKGASKGVGVRIGMDVVDSALDGFVRPALNMIYKDYGQGNFVDNYKTAFAEAGGWDNVKNLAIMGGIASAAGEYMGARRLLKSANGVDDGLDAKRIFESEGGNGGVDRLSMEAGEEMFGSASYKRATTIDGDWVRHDKNIFNKVTGSNLPEGYRWFSDGSYIPSKEVLQNTPAGSLSNYEVRYLADDMISIIEKNKKYLTAGEYTQLMDSAKIFKYAGCDVTANELKLICFHSEGNASRIRSVLSMTHGEFNSGTLDQLSDQLSKQIFKSKATTPLNRVVSLLTNDAIDAFQKNGTDEWLSSRKIFETLDSKKLIDKLGTTQMSTEQATTLLRKILPSEVSDETLKQIANSDGLAPTIRKILQNGGMTDSYFLDQYSADSAAKVFQLENTARMKAVLEVGNHNYETALKLVSGTGDYVTDYHELFRSTGFFDKSANRMSYYSLIDQFSSDGLDLSESVFRSKYINSSALIDIGNTDISLPTSAVPIKTAKDLIFNYKDGVLESFDNTPVSKSEFSDFAKKHYMVDGKISASKLTADFETMMKKNAAQMDPKVYSGTNYDYQRCMKASQLMMQSYLDAVSNPNNPNRREALQCMAKMLELDSQGKAPILVNNGGLTGSLNNNQYINLSIPTIDGSQSTVAFHESGHFLFYNYGEQIPSGFSEARKMASLSFENNSSLKNTLQTLANNNSEINAYTSYLSSKELNRYAIDQGFNGIGEYRNYLIQKYSSLDLIDRSDVLQSRGSSEGMIYRRTFKDGLGSNLDVKDARKLADIEIYTRKQKIKDKVYVDLFPGYSGVSDIVDATSRGKYYIQYGHSPSYYLDGKCTPDYMSFHEILADYTSMKVSGDNRSIKLLRYMFGDSYIDMVDNVYQSMLK